MKPALFVLLCAAPAYADGGARIDFGFVHEQVAVTDQTAIAGSMARFGVGFAVNRHFHAGAEVEEGWMSGNALPDGAVARTGSSPLPTGPLSGNTLDMKLVTGLHTDVGSFRVSGDVAAGLRDTSVSTDLGMDVAGRKKEPLLELRTRVDMFVTHAWTVGLVAGADTLERRDVSLGAIVSLQLDR
ncbi:MAG: hypothetical protein JO257_25590 [Deltaproteobacteria bacterium]|nr:hypothetical protein [Deltaproteobacteria bacterium]